jgi:hypothetical protein
MLDDGPGAETLGFSRLFQPPSQCVSWMFRFVSSGALGILVPGVQMMFILDGSSENPLELSEAIRQSPHLLGSL